MSFDPHALGAVAAFGVSCVLTVLLILHRPYLQMRVQRRHLRIPTYFLGALFGPVVILALGILVTPASLLAGLTVLAIEMALVP